MLTVVGMGLCHSLNQKDQSPDCSLQNKWSSQKIPIISEYFLEYKYFVTS